MLKNKYFNILSSFIKENINNDYAFLDLPYYSNVGDVLIWEATLQLLCNVKCRCVYSCSVETYRKPKITKDTILLFSGGGNFGDLWEKHQRFRHKVMEDFPENPIVQLPQSVCFEDKENMLYDIQCYKNHRGKVCVCLRDQQSYDIISSNYTNVHSILLPDMVLSLDIGKVLRRNNIKLQKGDGTLYFKRDDKEFVDNHLCYPYDAEGDWPCRQEKIESISRYERLMGRLIRFRMPEKIRLKIARLYYRHIIKDAYLRNGINFLMPYKTIYATRLHAAILGALLGKQVYMIDNSYHKCSGVYNLWMKDFDNVVLL